MERVWQGGLSGKARQVRYRNRVARLHAQQMITEYLESDPLVQRHDRYIPIRGRNEFLPSVAQVTTSTPQPVQQQLELPFKRRDKTDNADRSATTERTTPLRETETATDTVIRFPRTAKETSALPLKPPQQFGQRREKFTIGGFLVGCAMGSAAAVLALLVLQTVVG